MSRLRTAVIGVGHLGRFHAQKYKMLDDISDLVGVCDANAERADEVAKELGVKSFTNVKDLVGLVDAVTIAATTSSHFELGKFFLSNGIHVNMEKPLTTTSEEGRALCELAQTKNLVLQVGHVERFNAAFLAVESKLKTPRFIECHRLAPFKPRGVDVNVVLDLMIHDLDVILHLVKSKPVLVHAIGTPVITKTFDIANARIEFENGTVANVTASRVSIKTERKFRIFQDEQYLSLDFGGGEVRLLTKAGEWEAGEELPPIDMETWNLEKSDALLEETKSFIESVKDSQPPVVSGLDGLNALMLAEQIIGIIDSKTA